MVCLYRLGHAFLTVFTYCHYVAIFIPLHRNLSFRLRYWQTTNLYHLDIGMLKNVIKNDIGRLFLSHFVILLHSMTRLVRIKIHAPHSCIFRMYIVNYFYIGGDNLAKEFMRDAYRVTHTNPSAHYIRTI